MSGGGMERCSTQTTPQATACIAQAGPPRISAAALLQLAQWCRSRRDELLGQSLGGLCPIITDPQSPPAPSAHEAGQDTDSSFVGPARSEASASPAGAQPDPCQDPPEPDAEGGQP